MTRQLSIVARWLAMAFAAALLAQSIAPDKPAGSADKAAETGVKKAPALGPPADNSRCFVCHINYEEEKLALAHARKGVACVKCHGSSDAHCGDENNITAPEIMYARAKIVAACIVCHEAEEILAVPKHKPDLEAIALQEKICTDCHNEHRLPRRARHWDRETGKLLTSAEAAKNQRAAETK